MVWINVCSKWGRAAKTPKHEHRLYRFEFNFYVCLLAWTEWNFIQNTQKRYNRNCLRCERASSFNHNQRIWNSLYEQKTPNASARAHTNIESMQPFCESPNFFFLLSLLMPLKTLSTTLNEQREVYTMLWIVIYLIFTLIALFSSLSLFSFTFVTLWLIDILLRLQFTAKPEQVACILKL